VVNGLIPKISYSTFLSQYFILAYATTAVGVFESMASYGMWKFSAPCLIPATPNASTTGPVQSPPFPQTWPDCWAAYYFDWATLCIGALCEIVYTLVFLHRGQRQRKGETIIHPRHVQNPHAAEKKGEAQHEHVAEGSHEKDHTEKELKTVKVE